MRLSLRVRPRARQDRVVGVKDGVIQVRVTAPPEGGRANDAVVALLAERLHVPKGAVLVIRGHTSRLKVVWVPLEREEVERRLGLRL